MLFRASIFFLVLSSALLCDAYANTIHVTPKQDLQSVINSANEGDTLLLSAGTWSAKPTSFHDSLCGNCINPEEGADATYGFHVTKNLAILGDSLYRARLVTNAGYGLYIENTRREHLEKPERYQSELPETPQQRHYEDSVYSTEYNKWRTQKWEKVELKNLYVTGGKRDTDSRATDGGIVVRNSIVHIGYCSVEHNSDLIDSIVVGIAGIVGRENGHINLENTIINENSWDGIAMYRGAYIYAQIVTISNGRGVGVGITWNAYAIIDRVNVSHYWKGIGSFGNSKAQVSGCVIRDNLGWGLIATGRSHMDTAGNIIIHNGNCGAAIWSDSASMDLSYSVIADNGWKKQWIAPRVGFWYGGNGQLVLDNNVFWNNDSGSTADAPFNVFKDTTNYIKQFEYHNFYIKNNVEADPGKIDSLGNLLEPEKIKWKERKLGPYRYRQYETHEPGNW